MTVVGLDDTDSRGGQCTTYVATRIAERLEQAASVSRCLLVRCNPAVEHKTRGNAALAIHTDATLAVAEQAAAVAIDTFASPDADPGLVVVPDDPAAVPPDLRGFTRRAVRGHHRLVDARRLCRRHGFTAREWNDGRGLIGALAAVGAWRAFADWTVEHLAYRHPSRWGTDRDLDEPAVRSIEHHAGTWETVDRGAGEVLCAPRTPCPVLFGVRGRTANAVDALAVEIRRSAVGEPVDRTRIYLTNQGTDAHLRTGRIGALRNGRSYRVTGTVSTSPETRRGGHVDLGLVDSGSGATLVCVAFEPTKRFRDRVRALRPGDRVTVCGEVARDTLKLEKFRLRDRVETTRAVPRCPDCERSMESAGSDAGYRCRRCGTTAPGRVTRPLARDIEVGWYEVPPRARRHIAKPLSRGGFDGPVHAER